MNWYKILTSAKRETVTLQNGKELTYLINPSQNDLYRFVLRTHYREARGANLDGDLIVWDAKDGSHRMVLESIGYKNWRDIYNYNNPKGYVGDAMIFNIGPNRELRSNPSLQDSEHPFFKEHSIPYVDPREHGDDFDFFTHEIPVSVH